MSNRTCRSACSSPTATPCSPTASNRCAAPTSTSSQRYRHIVSSTLILGEDKNLVRAQANFLVVRIMLDGDMRLFMSGRYLDIVDVSGPSPLFAEKRVIFDNRRIDTLLALPI